MEQRVQRTGRYISFDLRSEKAGEYFEDWFESANRFLSTYYIHIEKSKSDIEYLKDASFNLHQAAERFYISILLVFTDYKGKTHDLEVLDKACSDEDLRFRDAFPRTTKEEQDLFQLLREAYIGSRYKRDFKITKEELEYLAGRVEVLKELADTVCNEKINYFKEIAEKYPGKIIKSKKPNLTPANNYGSNMNRVDSNGDKANLAKVKEEGRKEGIKEGETKEKIKIAKSLLDILDVKTIAAKVGLSIEEIEKLKK